MRKKYALAAYTIGMILWTLLLLTGLFWVKRNQLDSSLLGGLVAVLILGFMLPKMVLQRTW